MTSLMTASVWWPSGTRLIASNTRFLISSFTVLSTPFLWNLGCRIHPGTGVWRKCLAPKSRQETLRHASAGVRRSRGCPLPQNMQWAVYPDGIPS